MNTDEKYSRLNERLEGVNTRLRAAVSDSFLSIQSSAEKTNESSDDLARLGQLSSEFTAEFLLYVKRKKFDARSEASALRAAENLEKAAGEAGSLAETVGGLVSVARLVEKGELSRAMMAWRGLRGGRLNARGVEKVTELLGRFQETLLAGVARKAREQLRANMVQVGEFLTKFESAVLFGFRSGSRSMLESSTLLLMVKETRGVFEDIGDVEACETAFAEEFFARLQNVTLKNLGVKPLQDKLVELFALLALYQRINVSVFRGRLQALAAQRALPDFLPRVERRLRETDPSELGPLINLVNFLGGLFLELDLKPSFLLFHKILESAIQLYVEKHCAAIFAEFARVSTPAEALFQRITLENEKQARKFIRGARKSGTRVRAGGQGGVGPLSHSLPQGLSFLLRTFLQIQNLFQR